MRCLPAIDPELLIESDGVDNQRVFFPFANRMPVEAGAQVRGMWPAVHVNGSERMWSADIHDHDPFQFREVDDLDIVGREELPRATRGLAAGVGFELVRTPVV